MAIVVKTPDIQLISELVKQLLKVTLAIAVDIRCHNQGSAIAILLIVLAVVAYKRFAEIVIRCRL